MTVENTVVRRNGVAAVIRRIWFWLLLIALIVGLVAGRYFYQLQVYGPVAQRLPAELAGARREGLPLTPADLRPIPSLADEQNAASIYREIHQLLQAINSKQRVTEGDVLVRVARQEGTNADRVEAHRIITQRADMLALAERAGRLPHCDFHWEYEKGQNLLLPEFASLRDMGRLLAAKAILESEAGDPEAALRTVRTGAKMARHVGESPILIAYLVDLAIRAMMHRAFVLVVLTHSDRPEVLRLAHETNDALGLLPDYLNALGGEVVFDRIMLQMIRKGPADDVRLVPNSWLWIVQPGGSFRGEVSDAWEVRMLQYWRASFAAIRAHRGDPIATYNGIKKLGDEADARSHAPTYELSAILMPVFSQAYLKSTASEAEARLRATLLELLAYRTRSGAFPSTIAELPTPAIDPFTARPLRYRRTRAGFVLYSIGPDIKDDGGKAQTPDPKKPPPDIVIECSLR